MSIGPETDSVLSQYKIPDDFIPRLRVLSQTVRSSNWKYKLRTADYGLTLEQALHVSEAMVHDIENKPGFRIQVASTSFLSHIQFILTFCTGQKFLQENHPIPSLCSSWSCVHFIC